MLKLIPQEYPEKGQNSSPPQKRSKKARKLASKIGENLPKTDKEIVELTGKKLIHYSMSPNTHTEKEKGEMIRDMHRSILHLQQSRQQKLNKKRKKR